MPTLRFNSSFNRSRVHPSNIRAGPGALSTFAHMENKNSGIGAAVINEDGTILYSHQIPTAACYKADPEKAEADRVRLMMLSNDPSIWSRLR
jgi:hypothetical protein